MKQTLSLRLGQQLSMTPQLRQAIRMMQLSAAEMRMEVRQALETNPMLELAEPEDHDEAEDSEPDAMDALDAAEHGDEEEDSDESDAPEHLEAIPEDLPVDVSWDDVYQPVGTAASKPAAEDDRGFEERNGAASTLLDHLHWQLNVTPMTDRDRLIAHAVIDSIDDDGMLRASTEELRGALVPHLTCEVAEIETVVKLVQHFDPPGVAARDLPECLLLQLEQQQDTPPRRSALDILRRHFKLLASGDLKALARRTKLDDDALRAAIALIRSLNPRPGASIGDSEVEYVEPDVVVRRQNGRWTVALNTDAAPPPLRLQHDYAGLVKRADKSAENQYLKENLQDAKWFLKNLEYRNETLLKVAAEIVDRQRGFLEHGEEAMQPLVLADIAVAVERHESTISRVTTGKYMDTPRGIFELKYFFSSHVGTSDGGEMSSTAIRALIKKLVAEEKPGAPLSDNKIAILLKERDINVARRTVAKYREALGIAPSNERRRLA